MSKLFKRVKIKLYLKVIHIIKHNSSEVLSKVFVTGYSIYHSCII